MQKTITTVNNSTVKTEKPTRTVTADRTGYTKWVNDEVVEITLGILANYMGTGYPAVTSKMIFEFEQQYPMIGDDRYTVSTISGILNKAAKQGKVTTWQQFNLNSIRNPKLYSI